ncbi:MAG: hypothetical protein M1813_002700 [Trichoglossum hirsutum]|nr:MAG: hypothetical protein M1813_002700 [Trichoglossum hirsutum]
MATAETVELGPPHEPTEASISTFKHVLPDVKKTLVHLRHTHNSTLYKHPSYQSCSIDIVIEHESEYFAAVASLSDNDLVALDEDDLVLVRVGTSAYGLHLFGKVRLPKSDGCYFHVRMFVSGESENRVIKLHSIYNGEKVLPDGTKTFRAILSKDDPLEWFDT